MLRFATTIVFVLSMASGTGVSGNGEGDQARLDSDLKYAVINEDKLAVRHLLEQGADPNVMEGNERSALLTAASKGNIDIVKMLVEAGADVNASHPKRPRSILAEAAAGQLTRKPTTDIVRYLLDKGAQPDSVALATAARSGNPETVQLLLDAGISPDAGLGPAAGSGQVDIIDQLLKAGADVNGDTNHPPISAAAAAGKDVAVEKLLKAGANPNIMDERERSPLHWAVHGDRGPSTLRVVKQLIDAGAQVDLADNRGVTPIRDASLVGATSCYDWLLEQCGGVEPRPANIEDDDTIDTEQLLDRFLTNNESKAGRIAAQRMLVARGESIMTALLPRIKANGLITPITDLLEAMGPRANGAILYLESLLDDEEQVFGALALIESMKPHSIERLSKESKKRAAESLVKGIHKHSDDVYGPFLMGMLVALGEDSTPHLLRFLDGENPGFRAVAAKKLQYASFDSPAIESRLVDILLHDPIIGVREYAARGLKNPCFHSQEAKFALIEVLATPRVEIDADVARDATEEERRKLYHEKDAIEELLREASWALATYGPSLIPQLRDYLARANGSLRGNYDDVYRHLADNPESVAAFAQLLDDPNDAVRKSAHDQMARLAAQHSDEAGDLLAQRYTAGNAIEQAEAARALVRISVGRRALRYLPHQLLIVEDAELDRKVRMSALNSALRIDSEAVKNSKEAATFLVDLVSEIENGEYNSRLFAMRLVGELGSAAVPAKEVLESLSVKPLPEKPEGLSKRFRIGIDDQPDSAYQKYARDRHAAEMIRQRASGSLKAIKADSME